MKMLRCAIAMFCAVCATAPSASAAYPMVHFAIYAYKPLAPGLQIVGFRVHKLGRVYVSIKNDSKTVLTGIRLFAYASVPAACASETASARSEVIESDVTEVSIAPGAAVEVPTPIAAPDLMTTAKYLRSEFTVVEIGISEAYFADDNEWKRDRAGMLITSVHADVGDQCRDIKGVTLALERIVGTKFAGEVPASVLHSNQSGSRAYLEMSCSLIDADAVCPSGNE